MHFRNQLKIVTNSNTQAIIPDQLINQTTLGMGLKPLNFSKIPTAVRKRGGGFKKKGQGEMWEF